ncbi:MAG: excinuclease ABC subunit UvrC [Alphaproteobacteria bacterium]|nr:excinuclease ABC subunit UvrC [Alphaproteobacteria bacterium]
MGTENKLQGVDILRQKIKYVSHKAGVYRMIDETGTVLYVGKAKNLKNRLTNYTQTERLSNRIRQMVSQVADLIVIETAGETEAFLLENDLIKQYKPFYNILLKDDKSYPYIVLTDETPARLLKYRGERRIKGTYFGPFSSVLAVNQTIKELQKIFGLRTCNNTYYKNRSRPCLLYQIKRCSGPCCQCISSADYEKSVQNAKAFMRGEHVGIQKVLQQQMDKLAADFRYEEAAVVRDKILALNHIQDTDSATPLKQTDIVAVYTENGKGCIQVFLYRTGRAEGNLIQFFQDINNDNLNEVLSSYLMQVYDKIPAPRQIYLSILPENGLAEALSQKAGYTVHIGTGPFKGTRKKLMEQALENAKRSFKQTQNEKEIKAQVWEELRQLLNVPILEKVEVYDNSHIQGTAAVGAMIAANQDGFQKKWYRRYNIDGSRAKTNDDFGMMKEVMYRRLSRGVVEKDLPTAMLIDGGKGQLSAVQAMMDELGIHSIALLAVAKGEQRNAGKETLFHGSNPNTPIHLDLKSDLIHLIQRLRDEAHRFAIGTHRMKRAKNMFHETILDIEGIGEKRKKALLRHFGSPKAIAGASLEQIQRVEGISEKIAKKVYTFYHD